MREYAEWDDFDDDFMDDPEDFSGFVELGDIPFEFGELLETHSEDLGFISELGIASTKEVVHSESSVYNSISALMSSLLTEGELPLHAHALMYDKERALEYLNQVTYPPAIDARIAVFGDITEEAGEALAVEMRTVLKLINSRLT